MRENTLIKLLRPLQFRGEHRLLGRLVPERGTVSVRVHDSLMDLDVADLIQRQMYLGCYERTETRIFQRLLRPGDTVIDVGANVGYFTALAAKRVGPTGSVHAIEPSPYAFDKLQKMVSENSRRQVRCYPLGLSDQASTINLYVAPQSRGNHTPTMVPHALGQPVPVQVRPLGELLKDWAVQRVALLKVDVEGHEPRVIAGARDALAAGVVRNILIELNDHWLRRGGSSNLGLLDSLRQLGFVLVVPRVSDERLAEGVHTVWMRHG
jgi:FkbM family methyltransferase